MLDAVVWCCSGQSDRNARVSGHTPAAKVSRQMQHICSVSGGSSMLAVSPSVLEHPRPPLEALRACHVNAARTRSLASAAAEMSVAEASAAALTADALD